MKCVGGVFEVLCAWDTLVRAAYRAALGKRQRSEVRRFFEHFDEEITRMAVELREGAYRFAAYRAFPIRDPKTRVIHAPPFRDRVVHHAIVLAAGAVFERGAIAHSYACRTGRGQHAALVRLRRWVRDAGWFVKLDVEKFYDSIAHDVLRLQLARRFRERRLLALFDRLLASYAHAPGRGVPIGALTSQYLGNFYLDPFDHWATRRSPAVRYLRYMDDMLFLGERASLAGLPEAARAVLAGLGLRIKGNGVANACALGVPYVGFVVYPDRMRLNRQGRKRLRRRVKQIELASARGEITERELQARAEALFAHARAGDDVAWRRMVAGFSRLRETHEPQSRPAGRLVEQRREQVPLGVSQQEQAG